MVALLWLFAALFMIPNLTGTWGETGFEESTFSCTVLQQPEKERGINPLRVIMAIGISLPLIVIGASYSILLKVRVCFLEYIYVPCVPFYDNSRAMPPLSVLQLIQCISKCDGL